MNKKYDFDLFVIGAGSGGVACARRAASYGAKVAICESDRVGGTCVIRGCVPKKLLMYAGQFSEHFEDAAGFGWELASPAKHNWQKLITNKDKEINRLNTIYCKLLKDSNVEHFKGYGKLQAPHEVEVNDKKITAKYILLAMGGQPWIPSFEGSEHTITSNEIFDLKRLPKKLAIIGGGYIAVEFASILNALGVEVEMLIRANCILNGFDCEIAQKLREILEAKNIKIRNSVNVSKIEKKDNQYKLTFKEGHSCNVDLILSATGRKPNLEAINFMRTPLKLSNKGGIKINDFSQTNIPSIFAVGDITNIAPLTPVAIRQGREVAEYLFNQGNGKADISVLPTAVFTSPAIGTVGMSQEEALEEGLTIDIYKASFKHLKHHLSGRDEKIFMKLIIDHQSQKILGAHMIGDDAAEIIQMTGIALSCGATKNDFDRTVALHPSVAEEFVTMRDFKTLKGKQI